MVDEIHSMFLLYFFFQNICKTLMFLSCFFISNAMLESSNLGNLISREFGYLGQGGG